MHPAHAGVACRVQRRGMPWLLVALALAATMATMAMAEERALPLSALRSGVTFAGADVRAMQDDDIANPGMLWVERGEKLWNAPLGASGKSCASCHGAAPTSMRGVHQIAGVRPALRQASTIFFGPPGKRDLSQVRDVSG